VADIDHHLFTPFLVAFYSGLIPHSSCRLFNCKTLKDIQVGSVISHSRLLCCAVLISIILIITTIIVFQQLRFAADLPGYDKEHIITMPYNNFLILLMKHSEMT